MASKKKIAYFDNAATTFPKPEIVYQFMDEFYRQYGVNVGRGQHSLANEARLRVDDTRKRILRLLHCTPDSKVVFTSSATESMNVILQGLPWENGMNVYVSPFEHNAVMRVLNHIGKKYNINLQVLHVEEKTLFYDLESIKYQFHDQTPHVVIVSHASNVCGAVAPIKEIFDLAKTYNAVTVVDMAQTAGLIKTDLSVVKADFAVFAGHKTLYGPLGIGGFIFKNDVKINPLLYGGTGVDSANPDLPEEIPERFEVGSPNILAISGLNAAVKWIENTTIEEIYKREQENKKKLISLIKNYDNIKMLLPEKEESIGVISCVFDDYASDSIGKVLDEQGVAVRTGLHCSPSAHRFMKTFPAGTVRFSVSYFTGEEDFEILAGALDYIQNNS
ncbi:aminotransferase class V-fold PLP-dependent enzyme [Acetobacterium bakii]|uniref:cysteine desulfurase n=1 Tax=Acetobacterium bakii TaxID=52689 RepID=A0A0L6U1P1_9FIRM|nr:aminotransferase class V-fold PLP-dependent enzyme [Acetobacterium bakii]KNZ41725.1 cysteine desulfurase [Acetobacterium bakii]